MAKITISRKEIEKMLKDQLGCKEVKWDGDKAIVELDLEAIKEKEKEEHHHHHYDRPWPYPIYIKERPRPYKPFPYWTVTNNARTLCYKG